MRNIVTAATVFVFAGIAGGALFLSGFLSSQAVQNPTISLDMVTTGNAYVPADDQDFDGLPDPGTNVMNVGAINNCLTTAPPGTAITHLHTVHLIMQNVENLIGWQARANFIGDQMRINTVNFTPFTDTLTGQTIGLANLPYDQGTLLHRTVTSAGGVGPAIPPDGTNTSQTHLFGLTYDGPQNFPISADSPYLADEGTQTYDAPTGGVLAAISLQVVGNESTTGPNGAQPSLFMNLDDNVPNPPGSKIVVFNGTGTTDINIAPANLGDGFHGEGITCVPLNCTTQECPSATATPTPTAPAPTGPSLTPPPPSVTPSPTASPTASATPLPGPTGPIAFSGNLDEQFNFDIYAMNPDGSGVTRLTSDPALESSPAWSPDGARIAFYASGSGSYDIYAIDADGSGRTNLTHSPADEFWPDWSPDGSKIVFHGNRDVASNYEIYVMNADGSGVIRLTNSPGNDAIPTWSPDGSRIAFESDRDGNFEIYSMNPDGTGVTRLTNNAASDTGPEWSPDGSKLAFGSEPGGNADIYVMNANGSGQTRLTVDPAVDLLGAWSPDGTKIVFESRRDNFESDIFVMNADGSGQTNISNSTRADHEPDWRALTTPTPTATPMPGTPTPTPTQTGAPGTLVTFTNNSGSTANDLHFAVTVPSQSLTVTVEQNAPGCAPPTVNSSYGAGGPDFTFGVTVVWPTSCVDQGESVTLRLSCQPSGCHLGTVWCSDWTIDGSTIGQPCSPTPNCGGVPCCNGLPCPTATATATPGPPTPTATPTPPTGHDARLTRIGGVPKNVRLSPGEVIADSANVVVANESNHAETIGVYVDVLAPSGCTPNGRVLQTTVTLGAGNKTTIPIPVSYSCADPSAADGQSYTWTAVADHGADDLASCPPGSLQSLACFNALADDDEDAADNRKSRTGPKVIAQ
jgi:WD40-like Beta Propeller Repeat